MEENGLNCAVVLYNSAKYDGNKNISVCSDRKVTNTEFFTNCDHVIIVACNEPIWGGKDTKCFIRKNTFESILKNNEKYGRKNAAIIYDEAHNYESKFDTIKELSDYFNVSVLMSGTPGKEQRNIHKASDHVDYSDGDIFDPCCGSGNLLAACAIAGAKPTNLYGNEIDPEILEICRSRLKKLDIPESHIKQGDATKEDVWFKTLSRSRRC